MPVASSGSPGRDTFPARIAYFITGHGYGHAARSARLINALPTGTELILFTTIEPAFFARELSRAHTVVHCEIDCGCVQRDAANIDVEATLARYRAINRQRDTLIARHAAQLNAHRAQLVIADIPPLAFPIAKAAGVPALGISNFTWVDIYADYVAEAPSHVDELEAMRADYALADAYLRLYPHVEEQPCAQVHDVGLLLGEEDVRARGEVAATLALDPSRPWCLIYFGASGLRDVRWSGLGAYPDWTFIGLYDLPGASANYHRIALSSRVRHGDVLAGTRAVLGKLGYGLVSECLYFDKPIIFPHRDQFREYGFLRDGLRARALDHEIAADDLAQCRLDAGLRWCLARPSGDGSTAASGTRDILQFISRWWQERQAVEA